METAIQSDSQPRVRRARAEDAADVHRLLVELGYPGLDSGRTQDVLMSLLRNPERTVLVAESPREGLVVGLAALSHTLQLRHGGPLVVVEEFVVREAERGMGVGRLLLREVREVARGQGAQRIELHTNRLRPSYLRGFYVKNGFAEVNSAVMRQDLHNGQMKPSPT